MSVRKKRAGAGDIVPVAVPMQEDAPEGDLCKFLQRIVATYKTADAAETIGNVYDAYVDYCKCYEMLNAFYVLNPERAVAIPPAKCIQSCGTSERTCNIKFFMNQVLERIKALGDMMAPDVEKLVLAVRGSSGEADEPDEAFACQSLKLPGGADKLCETWFEDVIGLQAAKDRLKESFIYPLLYPNLYGAVSGGVLLYGPPGTGKTMLARALINETEHMSRHPTAGTKCSRFLYFAPTTDMLKGKYVGETEKKITDLFIGASKLACKVAAKKGVNVISVIFIDEVDGLAPSRDTGDSQAQIISSAVNTLLQMMDGVNAPKNVVMLAATNYPESLDAAFRRRFQYQIPIDLPSQADIEEQLNVLLSNHLKKVETYKETMDRREAACKTSTKKTGAVGCAVAAADSEGCSKPDPKKRPKPLDWQNGPYAPYVRSKLTKTDISTLAAKCYRENYSGSDVARLFNSMVKMSATAALKAGAFYQTSGGAYISINCFGNGLTLPENASPRLIDKRIENFVDYISWEGVLFTNRLFTKTPYPLPSFADELYVNEDVPGKVVFVVRYDFTIGGGASTLSLFAKTESLSITNKSVWWKTLLGYYTSDQIEEAFVTSVLGDTYKLFDGSFVVWDAKSQQIAYAEVPLKDFPWDSTAMRYAVVNKSVPSIATQLDESAPLCGRALDTLIRSRWSAEKFSIVPFQWPYSRSFFSPRQSTEEGDYVMDTYDNGFAFTTRSAKDSDIEMIGDGGACDSWLRGNFTYVNWDMGSEHFSKAKLASKSTIAGSSKTKEQYDKFKQYVQTL